MYVDDRSWPSSVPAQGPNAADQRSPHNLISSRLPTRVRNCNTSAGIFKPLQMSLNRNQAGLEMADASVLGR